MRQHAPFQRYMVFVLWAGLAFALFTSTMFAQTKGIITGRVADSSGAVLQGARVELQPKGTTVTTNEHGEFTFINVPPGAYIVSISYVGFESVSQSVLVASTPVEAVNVQLKVKSKNEEIIVTAPRAHGEAEAINRTRGAD